MRSPAASPINLPVPSVVLPNTNNQCLWSDRRGVGREQEKQVLVFSAPFSTLLCTYSTHPWPQSSCDPRSPIPPQYTSTQYYCAVAKQTTRAQPKYPIACALFSAYQRDCSIYISNLYPRWWCSLGGRARSRQLFSADSDQRALFVLGIAIFVLERAGGLFLSQKEGGPIFVVYQLVVAYDIEAIKGRLQGGGRNQSLLLSRGKREKKP